MSEHKSQRIVCVKLLQDLLSKNTTAQYVIDNWPMRTGDALVDNIYSLLFHYRDDEDIRAKDSRYAVWQEDEIRKYVELLLQQRQQL